ELQQAASAKIANLLVQRVPLSASLSASLDVPARPLDDFIHIFGLGTFEAGFGSVVTRLALRALGGSEVVVFGELVPDLWSRDGSALDRLLTLVITSLPKHEERLRAELTSLVPSLPVERLLALLAKRAVYRERERTWAVPTAH